MELKILRGDDQDIPIIFTDANGAAINITDATMFFTIKKNPADTDPNAVAQVTQTSHTSPLNGATTIPITNAASSLWEAGRWLWNARLVFASGKVNSTDLDIVELTAEITQRIE